MSKSTRVSKRRYSAESECQRVLECQRGDSAENECQRVVREGRASP